jgi:hypothetical protein
MVLWGAIFGAVLGLLWRGYEWAGLALATPRANTVVWSLLRQLKT